MIYTIRNAEISVSVDEVGAQLMSLRDRAGHEYLWQGDAKYWTGRAYNLFPVIGRAYGGQYDFAGRTYDMPPHGIVRKTPLSLKAQTETCLTFSYADNEQTRKVYPFAFSYEVEFSLSGKRLSVCTRVENTGTGVLPFGVGGHPGFFVPMEEGLAFEDYFVEFPLGKKIRRCVLDDDVLFTGEREPYPLQNNRLPLTHTLFPVDALVLSDTGGVAVIASEKGKRRITMRYPDMRYMGLWHKPNTDAPYLCLEPWSMLPAKNTGRDDFMTKEDMVRLPAGERYENVWTVEVE